MSSPDVNLDKQKRRHKGPLIGFVVCALAVGALLMGYLVRVVEPAADPAVQVAPAADVSQ